MEETTFSLEGTQTEINPDCIYMVDFSKMTSVNNLITILASMAIAFPGNHPNIEALKPFLNLDNPIQKQGAPVEKSVQLPKLKPVK
jgi:hypothetical protein